jgi:predicted nuclease of predicted toxin-antitoxin system
MKLNEYVEYLKKSEPGLDKSLKEWLKFTPPKRKVKLFLDRNIPDELKEEIRAYHRFKVIGIAGENDSYEFIWNAARGQKAIILSLDKGDFWNDKKFPLQLSPGVILISAKEQSVDVYIRSLTRHLLNMDIIG